MDHKVRIFYIVKVYLLYSYPLYSRSYQWCREGRNKASYFIRIWLLFNWVLKVLFWYLAIKLINSKIKNNSKPKINLLIIIIHSQTIEKLYKSWLNFSISRKSGNSPYRPSLDPGYSPCPLLADLKRMLQGKRFGSNEGVIAETEAYFEAEDESFYKKASKC